jgi:DHA2 family multidrug resistance protein-like MFS transporter
VMLLMFVPTLVPEFPVDRSRRFDMLGAALSLAAVLPIVYGVKQVAAESSSVLDYLAIVFGAAAGLAFVRRLRTADHPMLDVRLFADIGFRSSLVANLVAMFGLVGQAVFTTQYLQSVLGMSPLRAALWSLAPTVVVMAAAPVAVALAGRVGALLVAAGSFTVAAVGFLVLTQVGDDSLVLVLVGATILAAGLICVMTVSADTAMRTVDPQRAGSASAVLETSSELGGAFGMALLGSVGAWAYRTGIEVPSGVPEGASRPATETLGGALAVAAKLPDGLGAGLTAAARSAFADAIQVEAAAGAGLMLLAAAVAVLARLRAHA